MAGSVVVSTRFPIYADMKLLIAAGISKIYFFGSVKDPEAVRLVNDFTDLCPNRLEIVKLELGNSNPQPR